MAGALDFVQWCTCECECGSATWSQQVASNIIRGEDGANTVDEPRPSGHMTITAKPKLWEVWVMVIAWVEIDSEEVDRVKGRRAFFEDHCGSLEETVSFMHWKEERDMGTWSFMEFHWKVADRLVIVSEAGSVMIDKLAQPKQTMPAYKHDSIE